MTSFSEVVSEVDYELAAAMKKFPMWPEDPIQAAAIVAEESGELVRASLRHTYECVDDEAMVKEALQTAAMAIRFVMNHEHYVRHDTMLRDQPASEQG